MIIFCPSTCADGDTLLPCVGESSRRPASADCTKSQAKFTHNDWKTGAQWRDMHQNSINLPAIAYGLDTSGNAVTMIHLKHK